MMNQYSFLSRVKVATFVFLVVLWLSFPLGQFVKYQIFGGFGVFFFDLTTGLVSLFILLRTVSLSIKIKGPLFLSWLLLASVWLISLCLSPVGLSKVEFFTSFLYLVRWLAGSSLIFMGWTLSEESRMWIVKLMVLAGLGLAISGLVQYVVFPYLGPLTNQGWDPHLYRLAGSFLDPGFTGFIFVCSLILLGLIKNKISLPKSQWAVEMGILFVSLLLTYSRASYLAFLASFGVVALRKRAYMWYIKVIVLFTLAVVLLPRPSGEGIRLERENSIKARIENWSHALVVFKNNPVLGVGFNAYRYAQERLKYLKSGDENHAGAGSDSSLLLILATSGIVGGVAFGWFVRKVFIFVLLSGGIFKEISISTLVALAVHFWFLNSLFYPWILVWIATLVGLCRVGELEEKKN